MQLTIALSNKHLCMYFKLSGSHNKKGKANKTRQTKYSQTTTGNQEYYHFNI